MEPMDYILMDYNKEYKKLAKSIKKIKRNQTIGILLAVGVCAYVIFSKKPQKIESEAEQFNDSYDSDVFTYQEE